MDHLYVYNGFSDYGDCRNGLKLETSVTLTQILRWNFSYAQTHVVENVYGGYCSIFKLFSWGWDVAILTVVVPFQVLFELPFRLEIT